jgi:hypothetical protein
LLPDLQYRTAEARVTFTPTGGKASGNTITLKFKR